jgi:death-on-curing protein
MTEKWRWIEVKAALKTHERQIIKHGGGTGIRDLGLLESALARPQTLNAYGEPDVFDLAACYGWGLARNHPFIDGNKRTAFTVCTAFLHLHGQRIVAPREAVLSLFLGVATGEVTEASLSNWLRTHCVPL